LSKQHSYAGAAKGSSSNSGAENGKQSSSRSFRRWTPGIADKLHHFVLSDSCTVSLQLFFGQLFVCLFVFIPQLAFPNACLASVFLYVGIILRQDLHIASYLASSVKILGAILSGSTLAGVVVRHSFNLPHTFVFQVVERDTIEGGNSTVLISLLWLLRAAFCGC